MFVFQDRDGIGVGFHHFNCLFEGGRMHRTVFECSGLHNSQTDSFDFTFCATKLNTHIFCNCTSKPFSSESASALCRAASAFCHSSDRYKYDRCYKMQVKVAFTTHHWHSCCLPSFASYFNMFAFFLDIFVCFVFLYFWAIFAANRCFAQSWSAMQTLHQPLLFFPHSLFVSFLRLPHCTLSPL